MLNTYYNLCKLIEAVNLDGGHGMKWVKGTRWKCGGIGFLPYSSILVSLLLGYLARLSCLGVFVVISETVLYSTFIPSKRDMV